MAPVQIEGHRFHYQFIKNVFWPLVAQYLCDEVHPPSLPLVGLGVVLGVEITGGKSQVPAEKEAQKSTRPDERTEV